MSNFLQAARHTDKDKRLPHQDAAWNWAWSQLDAEQQAEFLEMFRAAPALKEPPNQPLWIGPAVKIIKEFEGCRLESYRCPANVVTIGFGTVRYPTTGKPVQMGDKITAVEAESFLRHDVSTLYGPKLLELIPEGNAWSANRVAALISWAYNVGLRAVETSTLRKRIKAGEDPMVVVPEELPRWNKAGDEVLPGLVRRREAEVKLFMGDNTKPTATPPLQQGAVRGNPITVPWYSQLDSSTDEARRMCFSSSCAMLVATLKPGVLSGANGDDQYLKRVQQYGDTTDAKAQVHALSSFGIKAKFVQNADFSTIEQQINLGIPVPCGYLHRGPIDKPAGGGHWLCVVGYDNEALIVHDPWGEADLITGNTISSVARYCRYSRTNFAKRWMVEGPKSGWAIIAAA